MAMNMTGMAEGVLWPRLRIQNRNACDAASGHEAESECERGHGKAKMLFFNIAKMPESTSVVFWFLPISTSEKLEHGVTER